MSHAGVTQSVGRIEIYGLLEVFATLVIARRRFLPVVQRFQISIVSVAVTRSTLRQRLPLSSGQRSQTLRNVAGDIALQPRNFFHAPIILLTPNLIACPGVD